jgi:Flp pilus assembly pilin Flp
MKISQRLRPEEGAAAVEFALISGVLALLIFGMLQFGLAFFELQNLRAATREGARVGAVRGTVQQMRDQVQAYSGVTGIGASVLVRTRTAGALSATLPATTKPCVPAANGTTPDSVQAEIPLAGAPTSIQDIFTVDIPLMPRISMLGAKIQGEFRCEV